MALLKSGAMYESASRIAAQTGAVIKNEYGATCLHVYIDWTVEAATSTLTFTIQGRTAEGSPWYTLLAGAALTAVAEVHMRVDPRETASANLIAKDAIPAEIRCNVAVGDADAATYSVHYGLFG